MHSNNASKGTKQADAEHNMTPRQSSLEVSKIGSLEQLKIDLAEALQIKKGDLYAINGVVYKCRPIEKQISHKKLVVKKLDCVDRTQ